MRPIILKETQHRKETPSTALVCQRQQQLVQPQIGRRRRSSSSRIGVYVQRVAVPEMLGKETSVLIEDVKARRHQIQINAARQSSNPRLIINNLTKGTTERGR